MFSEFPGIPVSVVDTVGAGDGYSAGFLFSLLSNDDLHTTAEFAGIMGSFVASQRGALPEYSEELLENIQKIRRGEL